MITETFSEKETRALGEELGRKAVPGSLYTLTGDLGTGKTVFTQGFARGLGITEHVNSPTFTIVNEYLGERTLLHFDMYRLKSADELWDIGWDDYLERGAVCGAGRIRVDGKSATTTGETSCSTFKPKDARF